MRSGRQHNEQQSKVWQNSVTEHRKKERKRRWRSRKNVKNEMKTVRAVRHVLIERFVHCVRMCVCCRKHTKNYCQQLAGASTWQCIAFDCNSKPGWCTLTCLLDTPTGHLHTSSFGQTSMRAPNFDIHMAKVNRGVANTMSIVKWRSLWQTTTQKEAIRKHSRRFSKVEKGNGCVGWLRLIAADHAHDHWMTKKLKFAASGAVAVDANALACLVTQVNI